MPFKYNENGIPVYSSRFLNADIKDFYYIEGPAEFEGPQDQKDPNFIHSTVYILVEYTDAYGKVKLFREGVNHKNVKRTPTERFDACNRFTNEIDCNDLNSYGIEKMKCKFVKGKCMSIKQQLIEQKPLINIPEVSFKRTTKRKDKLGNELKVTDFYKTKLWNEAVKKANDYVVQLMVIKNLTNAQIEQVSLEQREKLTDYYQFLEQLNTTIKLERIVEDANYSNLKLFIENLTETEKETEKEKELPKVPDELIKYNVIQLPKIVNTNLRLSVRQLRVGNKYLLENDIIATLISKSSEELEFTDGTNVIKFKPSEQSVRAITLNEIVENVYFKITKDDLELIRNPPTIFKYTLIENEYNVKKNEVIVQQKKKEVNEVPLDILYLSFVEIYNQEKEKLEKLEKLENVINRNMIYNAMAKVHLGIFEKNKNGFLESFDIFPATTEAKVHAIKYSVDLVQLAKVTKDEIKLSDVINFYNKVLPTIKTVNQDIIQQLEYGLLNKDIKLLKKYVKVAEKQLANDNNESIARLVLDAESVITEYELKTKKQIKEEKEVEKESKKEEKRKEVEVKEKKEEKAVKVSYVVQKRRRRKEE